jgi:hypothetical protein
MHSSVETIETKHDGYSANKGSLDIIIPASPIDKVLPNLCIVCLRRQVFQHNQQDKKAHDKNDEGKRFDSGQETPKDCSHKYGQRDNREEGQCSYSGCEALARARMTLDVKKATPAAPACHAIVTIQPTK